MGTIPVHLTTGSDTTNGTSFTTASITPTANRLVLVAVGATADSGSVDSITVSGNSLTYEKVVETASGNRVMYLFRALGAAPSSGSLSIATGGAILSNCSWTVAEVDDVDTSGTNGSGAIVQSVQGSLSGGANTSISAPFAATPGAGNAGFGSVLTNTADTIVAGSGWTSLGTATTTAPVNAIIGEAASACPVAVEASWATGGNAWAVGVEIKAGASNLNKLKLGADVVGLRLGVDTPSKVYHGTTQVWP